MKYIKYIITILILLIPTLYFGIINNVAAMGIIIIPSAFAAILLNINELFERLSIIKLKDIEFQFKNTIEKANATIEQLLNMQYALTEISTETVYRAKFYGGMSIERQLALFENLYKIAEENSAKKIIDEPLKTAYQRLLSESFECIPHHISNSNDKKILSEALEKIYCFKGGTDIVRNGTYIPTPQAIKNFANSNFQSDASRTEVISGITEYEKVLNKYQDKYGTLELKNEILD